jgi:hypothetical protein
VLHIRQGLGRAIMEAAMRRAVAVWAAQRLYTHVEADNEVSAASYTSSRALPLIETGAEVAVLRVPAQVAVRLYTACGFDHFSAESRYVAASKLGQTVLLMAPAACLGSG